MGGGVLCQQIVRVVHTLGESYYLVLEASGLI